jgi:hypothetical protein
MKANNSQLEHFSHIYKPSCESFGSFLPKKAVPHHHGRGYTYARNALTARPATTAAPRTGAAWTPPVRPTAPAVYRPLPRPAMAQRMVIPPAAANRINTGAPPVYRPQTSLVCGPPVAPTGVKIVPAFNSHNRPTAPAVYRPPANPAAQRMVAAPMVAAANQNGPGATANGPRTGFKTNFHSRPVLRPVGQAVQHGTTSFASPSRHGAQDARFRPGTAPGVYRPYAAVQPKGRNATVVQRDIGFEFEVGDIDSRHPQGGGHRRLTKGEVVLTGVHYTLQGEDAGGGATSSIEFVTNPFPETKAGRSQLKQTLRDMKRVMTRLSQAGPVDQYVAAQNLAGAGVTTVNLPNAEVENRANPMANPQVTAAIRLDRVHDYVNTFGNQPGVARFVFAPGRTLAMAALDTRVQNACNYFQQQTGAAPSQELKGLLQLVGDYLKGASHSSGYPYKKALAQMLLRTDFATTFDMAPEGPRRNNTMTLNVWLHTAKRAGGAAHLNDVLLEGEDPAAGHLTIRQWLTGIYNGQDLLTRNTYPVVPFRGELESMGSLGAHTENVVEEPAHFWQQGGTIAAPVMEIRTLQRNLPVELWEALALDVFDNIRAMNQKRAYAGLRAPRFQWASEKLNHVGLATRIRHRVLA